MQKQKILVLNSKSYCQNKKLKLFEIFFWNM